MKLTKQQQLLMILSILLLSSFLFISFVGHMHNLFFGVDTKGGRYNVYVVDSTSSRDGSIIKKRAGVIQNLDCADKYIKYYENYSEYKNGLLPCAQMITIDTSATAYIIKYSRDSTLVKLKLHYKNTNGLRSDIFYVYHQLLHKKP